MGQHVALAAAPERGIGAYLAEPATTPRGGVVVVQEIFGVNRHIRSIADRLAAAGYRALAPAFFDHVQRDVELDYDRAGINRGMALARQLEMPVVLADVAAAAEYLAPAGRCAVVGFCWGGTVAFLATTRLALPAVSFYGSRNVDYLDETPRAALQLHFGERDPHISAAAVQRHRECLPEAELFTYADAGHGFNCDLRSGYAPASAALAWQRTLDFLGRELGAAP